MQKLVPFRWSRQDYQKLWKVDLFHDMRVFLVDGVIWRKPSASPPACCSIGLLSDWLHSLTLPGHHDRHYAEIEIDEWNSLVPRFSIVKGAIRDYSTAHPTTASWVIEVSESTLEFDTTKGVELFAVARVPEYWVLDLEHRRLLVYRNPEALPTGLGATAYRTHLTFGESESFTSLLVPSASVKVADMLP